MLREGSIVVKLVVTIAAAWPSMACAVNFDYWPTLNDDQVIYYLSNPKYASVARYGLTDSAGNSMDSPSIVQLSGLGYKYAAVYHSYNPVQVGYKFNVNIAVSNDLTNWQYIGVIEERSGMPRIAQVPNSSWVVMGHEKWVGTDRYGKDIIGVEYDLFKSCADLINRAINSRWLQPQYYGNLNGTPSIYDLNIEYDGTNSFVSGQFGFHFWNGSRDINAATTTLRMLSDVITYPQNYPSTTIAYNARFAAEGVSGNLGQRDTLITASNRYNVQEGNVGVPAASWDKWRIFLYKFGEKYNYPTGVGTLIPIYPKTPGGSTSFGNPSISIVDSPDGRDKIIVISYFVFSEGAAPGEGGSLLYYFPVHD